MDVKSELRMSNSSNEPKGQKAYAFSSGNWQGTVGRSPSPSISKIRLITWNIDFQAQAGPIRMASALRYLESLVGTFPSNLPVIIHFQEMVANDLKLLQAAPWIRARFALSDIDTTNWQTPYYGTTTLIDHRLPIAQVFRNAYKTQMDRDGLFVDILAGHPSTPRTIRFCNTHLESLQLQPPLRPAQFATVSQHLHASSLHAGLLAGDLNAIEPFDRTLHITNNLKDAYLEAGGKEDSDQGYTWGYQSYAELREKFGCSRLDKILYCGRCEVKSLERIGIGVRVEESKRAKMRSFGALEFVTDHYGLMADVVILP